MRESTMSVPPPIHEGMVESAMEARWQLFVTCVAKCVGDVVRVQLHDTGHASDKSLMVRRCRLTSG